MVIVLLVVEEKFFLCLGKVGVMFEMKGFLVAFTFCQGLLA